MSRGLLNSKQAEPKFKPGRPAPEVKLFLTACLPNRDLTPVGLRSSDKWGSKPQQDSDPVIQRLYPVLPPEGEVTSNISVYHTGK